MDFAKIQSWQNLIKLEKFIGNSPYQTGNFKIVLRIVCMLFLLSDITIMILGIYYKGNGHLRIVLENLIILFIAVAALFVLILPSVYENERKIFYEQVAIDWKTITNEEESKILQDFTKSGFNFIKRQTLYFCAAMSIYPIVPTVKMYIEYFTEANRTYIKKKLPHYGEYLVDEEEYYYFLILHSIISIAVGMILFSAYDYFYVMAVYHTCALLSIMEVRLNRVTEIMNRAENYILNPTTAQTLSRSSLIEAIELHHKALGNIEVIERMHNINWFILIILDMLAFAAEVTLILGETNTIEASIQYVLSFFSLLMHFYIIFWPAQMILDFSSVVSKFCYNCEWFKLSKESKTLLNIIMIRAVRHSQLTGGKIFILCMETFSKTIKLGCSYFTAFTMKNE